LLEEIWSHIGDTISYYCSRLASDTCPWDTTGCSCRSSTICESGTVYSYSVGIGTIPSHESRISSLPYTTRIGIADNCTIRRCACRCIEYSMTIPVVLPHELSSYRCVSDTLVVGSRSGKCSSIPSEIPDKCRSRDRSKRCDSVILIDPEYRSCSSSSAKMKSDSILSSDTSSSLEIAHTISISIGKSPYRIACTWYECATRESGRSSSRDSSNSSDIARGPYTSSDSCLCDSIVHHEELMLESCLGLRIVPGSTIIGLIRPSETIECTIVGSTSSYWEDIGWSHRPYCLSFCWIIDSYWARSYLSEWEIPWYFRISCYIELGSRSSCSDTYVTRCEVDISSLIPDVYIASVMPDIELFCIRCWYIERREDVSWISGIELYASSWSYAPYI
jgi:hypothetical protein